MYTTYFAKLRKLPKDIVPIAICGKSPEWYNGLEYKKLAPKYWFFKEWKETKDNDFYISNFKKEIIDELDANIILDELIKLANVPSDKIALVCYEKPMDFCHRHILSAWFRKYGIQCDEFIEKENV